MHAARFCFVPQRDRSLAFIVTNSAMNDTSNHDPLALKEKLNEKLIGHYPTSVYDYTEVAACVLFWENADKTGYQEEAKRVHMFFEKEFRSHSQLHAIPDKNSQFSVDRVIAELLEKYDSDSTLLIIFYGGHGDADSGRDEEKKLKGKRSIWAA